MFACDSGVHAFCAANSPNQVDKPGCQVSHETYANCVLVSEMDSSSGNAHVALIHAGSRVDSSDSCLEAG